MKKQKLTETVFKRVQKIIASDTSLRPSYITLDINLNEMGNDIDSLDIFNIITDIEEEFDIHIPEAKIHELMNVRSMVKFIINEIADK